MKAATMATVDAEIARMLFLRLTSISHNPGEGKSVTAVNL